MKYLFFLTFLLFLSCKQGEEQKVANTTRPQLSEDDLGPLFNFYTPSPKSQQETDENIIIEYLVENKINADRTGSGIYLVIEKKGDGDPVQLSDRLTTHYEGAFLDGRIFDSSYQKGKPLTMGASQGIKGWQEALLQLNIGGKCVAYVPSTLGYGKRGFSPVIPKNANLKFTIEVLSKVSREVK